MRAVKSPLTYVFRAWYKTCVIQRSMMSTKVKTARKQALLTQEGLAKKIGSSTRAVQHWEQGVREPRPMFLRRLSEVTGKPVGWFFEEAA